MQQSGVAFGTSGARGLVEAMTDQVCFTYTTGFLQYMASVGEFAPGMAVALAGDLRPSTPRILAGCCAAIAAQGGVPMFCGYVPAPAPALALHAYGLGVPSLMVTGSHIPDDRNGIKFNRAACEVLKPDELGIKAQQVCVPLDLFDAAGALVGSQQLPEVVHLRPSGNAPELRCYTEAASPERAAELNAQALHILKAWRVGATQELNPCVS